MGTLQRRQRLSQTLIAASGSPQATKSRNCPPSNDGFRNICDSGAARTLTGVQRGSRQTAHTYMNCGPVVLPETVCTRYLRLLRCTSALMYSAMRDICGGVIGPPSTRAFCACHRSNRSRPSLRMDCMEPAKVTLSLADDRVQLEITCIHAEQQQRTGRFPSETRRKIVAGYRRVPAGAVAERNAVQSTSMRRFHRSTHDVRTSLLRVGPVPNPTSGDLASQARSRLDLHSLRTCRPGP